MSENINQQSPEPNSELKSFKPYMGKKAPALIQIIAGIMWLGAAGLLLQGILNLLLNPVLGIITLAIAIFAIITGKSLFGMKKSAMRNALIMAILFAGVAIWSLVSAKFAGGLAENKTEIVEILYAVLLALIVFRYKEHFVN
jgi:hypothetical protein